jgi:hypothetical protein
MSLESQLAALLVSVDQLNINLQALTRNAGPATTPAVAEKPKKAPPAEVKKGTEPTPAPEEVAKEAAPVLEYKDIQRPFLALVDLNRERAAETIAKHGLVAPRYLHGAKPEQYAAILKDVNAVIAELQAGA